MDARKTDADQAAMRFSFHRQTIIENVIGPLSKATQPVTPLLAVGSAGWRDHRRDTRMPLGCPEGQTRGPETSRAAGGVPPAKQPPRVSEG